MKDIRLTAISNGTTIDHLPPSKALDVLKVLNIEEDKVVTLGVNLKSGKMKKGKKGVIMIEGKKLSREEIDKISLIAQHSTINLISNDKVEKKISVEIRDEIREVLACSNENCITKKDQVKTRFKVLGRKPISVRCHYCEKTMEKKEILNNILV